MIGRRLALLATVTFASCAPAGVADKPAPPISAEDAAALVKSTDNLPDITSGCNAFACDLYRALAKERERNLILSPVGAAITLAMAEAGARGETADQIAKALGQPAGDSSRAAAWGALLRMIRSERQAPVNQLKVASRLWVQSGYPLLDTFEQTTRQEFGAEVGVVDFRNASRATGTINAWAARHTYGHILDAMPESAISNDTRLVLMNAIYLLAKWEHPFEEHGTQTDSFFVAGTERIDVSMMGQVGSFRYAEQSDLQLVELEYRGGDLVMIVVLPKEKEGLANVEADLTAENLNRWMNDAKRRVVELHLPKFKLSESVDLMQALMAQGIRSAFSEREANFSGISEDDATGRLFISAALQKAVIQVDEEGTEAAAVSEIAVAEEKAEVEEEEVSPPVFRADHPFAFFIRDNLTGTLLFAGRVIDPREQ